MSDDKEYARYDSACAVEFAAARIATDPTCIKSKEGKPLVRFKVVAERANDRFEPLWLEVNVGQFNAKAASFLQKGDTVAQIRGALAQRLWGDDKENTSISIEFAEVVIPPALFKDLKERGFEGKGEPNWTGEDAPKKGKKSKAAPPKKGSGKAPAKKVIEVPDDDGDDEDLEIPEDDGDGEE